MSGQTAFPFQIGDLVRLKSGGPNMIVSAATQTVVVCDWFDGAKKMSDQFNVQTIEKATPPKPVGGFKKIKRA